MVNGIIFDFKTFNVLPANINNKIHLRVEIFGGAKMSYRFHHAQIHPKSVFDKIFTIAGYGRTRNNRILIKQTVYIL